MSNVLNAPTWWLTSTPETAPDPVQSKCVLTACLEATQAEKAAMCCHKVKKKNFAGISPLPTNGGCCVGISRGINYASHQYAIENTVDN